MASYKITGCVFIYKKSIQTLTAVNLTFFLCVVFSFLSLSILGIYPPLTFAHEIPPALCIINFTNRSPGENDWLSKAIADLLITDLSACGKFSIIERERMQMMFDELSLSNSGIIDNKTALEFGKIMQVDYAVFGNYLHKDGNLKITCFIVEIATQKLRRVESVDGLYSTVLKLEKDLALKIVNNFNLPLTDQERNALFHMSTRSVDAAKSYYNGIDRYDRGEYTSALMFFREAIHYDASFDDASFRVGQIFYDLGEIEHAMVALRRVGKGDVDNKYTGIAQFITAEITQHYFNLPGIAAQYYLEMANRHTDTSLSIVSSFRAALLFKKMEKLREAYRAFALTDRLYNEASKRKFHGMHSWSGIVTKNLDYYHTIAQKHKNAYFLKWHINGDSYKDIVEIPEDYQFVGPQNQIFITNKPGNYIIIAESGFLLSELKIFLQAERLPVNRAAHQHSRCHISVSDLSFGNTVAREQIFKLGKEKFTRIRLKYPCIGVHVSIKEEHMDLKQLKIKTSFVHASKANAMRFNKKIEENLKTAYDLPGVLYFSVFGNQADTIYALISESDQVAEKRLKKDIWITRGNLHTGLGSFQKMRVNSLWEDYHPCLTQDRKGEYWMVFCSRRCGKREVNLWLAKSKNCDYWTHPRKIAFDVDWKWPNFQEDSDHWINKLEHPQLMVDIRGLFWLSFRLGNSIYVTNSEDSWNWKKPVNIGSCYNDSTIGMCEGREDKALIAFNKGSSEIITEVTPELTFDIRDGGENQYKDSKYHLPGSAWKYIHAFRMPDGRFLLLGTAALNHEIGLYACISDDLIKWENHNLLNWKRYKLPPEIYKTGILKIIPLLHEECISLVTMKNNEICAQKLYLGAVIGNREQRFK
ncbi:MAG: CsgG/HfaB family protein [bacterium]